MKCKYGDYVKVKKGFYEGAKGRVVGRYCFLLFEIEYSVERDNGSVIAVSRGDVEKLED